ncbi:hypothetical protein SAMN04487770_11639 [Butyrivibrio sp. ob235]|uniref:hypothetical protein n=1 Tax=Butyrivibrio sp. ob235 TaxID=1761780 RepID=UPI0008B1E2F2|nr:hypothetical protein [Butyrivibrio sp. ob235]SEL73874.1 hypothetical protein SAMN04487770_11639 [Butyrivibrio sp. ob235]
MTTKHKNATLYYIIFSIFIFSFLLFFLTAINPLVVYDTDDWLYIGQFRKPIPMIGHWNPIKVFPETFMPLVSFLGVRFINPIIHNYCYSLTLAHGLFGSALLTLYFVEFSLLFYRKKLCSLPLSIGYGFLFIILHFITYIHSGNSNIFLIWSQDLTCFYNYTLSAVLNAALVMHSISYGGMDNLFRKSSVPHKILILVWVYFAIFSNLFSSIILAAYLGAELLSRLIYLVKNNQFNLKKYCSGNIMHLLLIICWFISNIIETTGGRAGNIGKSTLGNIPITLLYALVNIIALNIFITILGLVTAILWAKKCNCFKERAFKAILYFVLSISYLVLLSATAEPYYIYRAEIAIDILFFVFIALIAALNELIILNKKNARLLLILSGTIILLFIHPGKIYFAYNNSNISYQQCEALIDDIINQFHDAEASGSKEMILIVPSYDVIYNWPLADYAGSDISKALYNHKITQSLITISELKPDHAKNGQFGISEFDLENNLKKVYSTLLVK